MRRITATPAVAAVTVLLSAVLLAGCGSDSSDGPAASTKDPLVITIKVTGDDVTPNGERMEVAVGQPIELDVTADAPGEIHVHSTPEQEFEYDAGSTKLNLTAINRPGIVDIESHTLEKTIVQLEAK